MEINDPKIDAYLNGELSESERIAFENEAKLSPETWEHIQFQQFMIEGIRTEGAAELKDFIANRITEDEQNETTRSGLWWSIAATLVVLLVGLVINYKSASRTMESKMMAKNEEPSAQIAADSAAVDLKEEHISGIPPKVAQTEIENPPFENDFNTMGEQEADDVLLPQAEAEEGDVNRGAKSDNRTEFKTNVNDDLPDNIFMGKLTLTPILIASNATPNKKMSSATPESKNRGVIGNGAADTVAVYDRDADINVSKPSSTVAVAKAKSKAKSPLNKEYVFSLVQSGFGPPHMTIVSSIGNQTTVTLWNAGSTDILLFELNNQLYLQLGDQYYFYPQTAPMGVKQNLTPVNNANLLNTLRNR